MPRSDRRQRSSSHSPAAMSQPSVVLTKWSDFQPRPPRTTTSDGGPRSRELGLEGPTGDWGSSMESCRARIFSTWRSGESESLYLRISLDSCGACDVR